MPFYESPVSSPATSERGESANYDLRDIDQQLLKVADADAFGNPQPTVHMNEVLPGLWIGDIIAATNPDALEANGIRTVVSVLRGNVTISENVVSHQILVDDIASADLLEHLPTAVELIRQGLAPSEDVEQGRRGVLVHCQAGMSRSATVVAAYLMAEQGLALEDALDIMRRARSCVQPSDTFMEQLQVFQAGKYRVSQKDRATREFYRNRIASEVLNGDGSEVTSNFFAHFPDTPSTSRPPTPTIYRRRKLRCASCRQELALREHVLHSVATPVATPPTSLPGSRQRSARNSFSGPPITPLTLLSPTSDPPAPSLAEEGAYSKNSTVAAPTSSSVVVPAGACVPVGPPEYHSTARNIPPKIAHARSRSFLAAFNGSLNSGLRVATDNDADPSSSSAVDTAESPTDSVIGSDFEMSLDSHTDSPLHRRLSQSRLAALSMTSTVASSSSANATSSGMPAPAAAEVAVSCKTNTPPVRRRSLACSSRPDLSINPVVATPPPILGNPLCSGYFLEPMDWMTAKISTGQLSGKITCPNVKCGAKIGNFDWAGQKCGCREWICPGFCVHRSKVDDIAY